MARLPEDSFDRVSSVSSRNGAHRGPRPRGQSWRGVGYAALSAGFLVALGTFVLWLTGSASQLPFSPVFSTGSLTETPVLPTDSTVSPSLTVTILNGTQTPGLAGKAADQLSAVGWVVGAKTNASSTDIKKTMVYYSDPAHAGAARRLALTLGNAVAVSQSQDFPGADLTVVLGADYGSVP